MVLERLELALAADAGQGEVAILILSDEAGADELLEKVKGCITMRLLALHDLHLGLEGIVLHELGLSSLLFQHLGVMLVFDLLLGPLPFAGRL